MPNSTINLLHPEDKQDEYRRIKDAVEELLFHADVQAVRPVFGNHGKVSLTTIMTWEGKDAKQHGDLFHYAGRLHVFTGESDPLMIE